MCNIDSLPMIICDTQILIYLCSTSQQSCQYYPMYEWIKNCTLYAEIVQVARSAQIILWIIHRRNI